MARFLENPKETHLMVIKRILRYLKGTINYGLFYKRDGNFAFTGSDWVGCVDDIKRTSGGASSLGKRLVSWKTKN